MPRAETIGATAGLALIGTYPIGTGFGWRHLAAFLGAAMTALVVSEVAHAIVVTVGKRRGGPVLGPLGPLARLLLLMAIAPIFAIATGLDVAPYLLWTAFFYGVLLVLDTRALMAGLGGRERPGSRRANQ